jgi:hypothetical protein
MSDKVWFSIDPTQFRKPIKQELGRATVVSSLSPYAVPDAVATSADPQKGVYIFEIKYIGSEEPVEALNLVNLQVARGRNSKRLFKVSLTQPGLSNEREAIFESIKNAIAKVAHVHSWPMANDGIVTAVIDQNKSRLPISWEVRFSDDLNVRDSVGEKKPPE